MRDGYTTPTDEEWEWAKGFLVQSGALEECDDHDGCYFNGPEDVVAAYKELSNQIRDGEFVLKPDQKVTELRGLLKRVYDDNCVMDECPIRANERDE